MGKAFEEGDLHLLGLCEVGGHKQGLKTAGICPQDLVDGVLAEKEYRAAAMQAYMSVWHEAGAAKPDGVSLQLWQAPTCVALAPLALDPHGHNGKVGRLVNRVARNRVAYTREE